MTPTKREKGRAPPLISKTSTTEKILTQIKGLRTHLLPAEQPLLAIPAIWDSGQKKHSTACDVVLTNQRLFGYYTVIFPRERLFLDALVLADIRSVSVREKNFEPIFRELLVSDGQRKVYMRAPRQKIEILYAELRTAIETYTPATETVFGAEATIEADPEPAGTTPPTPVYGRQEIRTPFESSNLAMVILFLGGLLLEIGGALLWAHVGQTVGLPLCIAGFVLVLAAILQRRQRR